MKKIIYSMLALFMALSFTSCEDVPSPYNDPTMPDGGHAQGTYLDEKFTANKGSFDIITVKGKDWKIDHNVMTASGYDFDTKSTVETQTYLVSPEFNLSKTEGAYISFKYIHMYVTPEATCHVLITDNFTGDPTTTDWKDLSIKWKESEIKDFETYFDYSMDIPAEYIGKEKVTMAFFFECSAVKSCTFKVKDLLVKDGKAEINNDDDNNDDNDDVNEGEYLNETFSKDFGKFSVSTLKGEPWIIDQYGYAKGTGHQGKDLPAVPSDSYLVSSAMDMTQSKGAYITFEYVLRYVRPTGKNQVLVTDNYTGDPATTQWTDITGNLTEVDDWKDWQKFSANIPEQFAGKNKVVVALHFTCEEESGTWEVKNLVVKEGKAEDNPGGGDEPGGDTPDVGDPTASNGDFETWVDGEPNNWNGPASKANLFQSEDAHSGKYSVQVGGSSDGNMRLGYKTLTLKPGHYVMKFFVKAVTAEGGAARPGLVVLTNGKPAGGSAYKYGDYINDLKQDAWTEATHEFDIDAEGEYTVVVMNAKNPGKDILVDDFSLECNGEFIIK